MCVGDDLGVVQSPLMTVDAMPETFVSVGTKNTRYHDIAVIHFSQILTQKVCSESVNAIVLGAKFSKACVFVICYYYQI